jgi:phosphatidylserine/phosphatidylglycerophosphate/cardiolipin synthase-like enzyme
MNNNISMAVIIFLTLLIDIRIAYSSDLALPSTTPIQVCFSPKGGCADAIINHISKAKTEILIQTYYISTKEIADAIIKAHKRGIHVEVVTDHTTRTDKDSIGDFMGYAGISTYIDNDHAIVRNKIMIIDKETVITGIFNFTDADKDRNAEKVIIAKDKSLAKYHIQNWVRHKKHSEQR